MKIKQDQAWLFSFIDLAFLLVISLSLIPEKIEIDIRQMDVPEVPANPNTEPITSAAAVTMLQVLRVSEENPKPFRIMADFRGNGNGYEKYVEREDLIRELKSLKAKGCRPILNPAGDSVSRDLLFAAGAIAHVWSPGSGKALIRQASIEKSGAK